MRWVSAGRQRRPPSPTIVAMPSGRPRSGRRRRRPPARRAPARRASGGPGARCRRCCRETGAHAAAPMRRAGASRPCRDRPVASVDHDAPRSGRTSPKSTATTVLLPAPLGPTRATRSPRRSSRSTPAVRALAGRVGVGTSRSATSRPGSRAAVRRAAMSRVGRPRRARAIARKMRSAAARPSALAWNFAPTARTRRTPRGEQQHGEPRGERQVAGGSRTPIVTGHHRHRQAGGQLEHHDDRNAMRRCPSSRVVALADPRHDLRLLLGAGCGRAASPAAHDIEKWPPSRRAPASAPPRARARQPIRP